MYTQFGRGMLLGGQHMMDGGLGLGAFGILHAVGFFIAAAAIVALVIWVIAHRSARSGASGPAVSPGPASTDAALAIARERLARGEIDPGQYTAIADALAGPRSAPTIDG